VSVDGAGYLWLWLLFRSVNTSIFALVSLAKAGRDLRKASWQSIMDERVPHFNAVREELMIPLSIANSKQQFRRSLRAVGTVGSSSPSL
jgi:hypothetical protein